MTRHALPLLLLLATTTFAQHPHPADTTPAAVLMPGLGAVHHPVSTNNSEAQKFFDQGLALIFGFNHEEAVRSFQRAAELDPACAMAWWGVALAVGPNYNDPEPDLNRAKTAWDAIQKARSLAEKASEPERAYIEALATRYSNDPKPDLKLLGGFYKQAMGELMKRYPDDLDAATLFAESAMDLNPWGLWTTDGKPAPGTEEIVATLQSVLKRDPNHTGANHYYIHAVEASQNPELARPSADRLPKLAPSAGHLVHMPAHIYMRTGDYRGATVANEQAAEVDRQYIRKFKVTGMYPAMYYNHNLHFLAVAASMEGRFADSRKAAAEVVANATPMLKDMPMVDYFMPTELLVLVRFHRWDDILKMPQPDKSALTTHALWRFARGMAFCGLSRVPEADAERRAMAGGAADIPEGTMMLFNNSRDVLGVAMHLLEGHISMARVATKAAVEHFRQAAALEDTLKYDEPPVWYIPARESLGRVLMTSNDYAEAEKAFREELIRRPKSGRALFGLWQCLKAQDKKSGARQAEADFRAAWKNADVKLKIEDL